MFECSVYVVDRPQAGARGADIRSNLAMKKELQQYKESERAQAVRRVLYDSAHVYRRMTHSTSAI